MLDKRKTQRTHYIHRISYSSQERIVGSFVMIAVAILLWLMFSSGKTQNIFAEQLTFYGQLATNKAVNKDTEVNISGLQVGTVTSVDVNDFSQIVITMNILKKYHSLLRTDSVATLTSPELAVLGNTVIDITPGSPELPLLLDGSTLEIKEATSLKHIMDKVGPIFTTLESSIQKMDTILSQVDPSQFKQTMDDMSEASASLNNIANEVESGKGIVTTSIYDDTFREDIELTMQNMQQASIKINQLLDELNEQVALVPELINKVGPLLNEADKTIKATQRIWPLSSAVGEDEAKQTLTTPESAND